MTLVVLVMSACTLTAAYRQERGEVLRRVGEAILEVKELDSGYAYRFPADSHWLDDLTTIIRLERECCQFLRFGVIAESGNGARAAAGDAAPAEDAHSLDRIR